MYAVVGDAFGYASAVALVLLAGAGALADASAAGARRTLSWAGRLR